MMAGVVMRGRNASMRMVAIGNGTNGCSMMGVRGYTGVAGVAASEMSHRWVVINRCCGQSIQGQFAGFPVGDDACLCLTAHAEPKTQNPKKHFSDQISRHRLCPIPN